MTAPANRRRSIQKRMRLLAYDSGVGSNANPIGGPYTTMTGGWQAVQRLSNQIAPTANDSAALRNDISPGPDQWALIRVPDTTPDVGAFLRTSSTGNGYLFNARSVPNGGLRILQINGYGSSATIGLASNIGVGQNDKVLFTSIGTVHSIYVNGVLRLRATDATTASGGIGVWLWNGAGDAIDMFACGDFVQAPVGDIAPDVDRSHYARPAAYSGAGLFDSTMATGAIFDHDVVTYAAGVLTSSAVAQGAGQAASPVNATNAQAAAGVGAGQAASPVNATTAVVATGVGAGQAVTPTRSPATATGQAAGQADAPTRSPVAAVGQATDQASAPTINLLTAVAAAAGQAAAPTQSPVAATAQAAGQASAPTAHPADAVGQGAGQAASPTASPAAAVSQAASQASAPTESPVSATAQAAGQAATPTVSPVEAIGQGVGQAVAEAVDAGGGGGVIESSAVADGAGQAVAPTRSPVEAVGQGAGQAQAPVVALTAQAAVAQGAGQAVAEASAIGAAAAIGQGVGQAAAPTSSPAVAEAHSTGQAVAPAVWTHAVEASGQAAGQAATPTISPVAAVGQAAGQAVAPSPSVVAVDAVACGVGQAVAALFVPTLPLPSGGLRRPKEYPGYPPKPKLEPEPVTRRIKPIRADDDELILLTIMAAVIESEETELV